MQKYRFYLENFTLHPDSCKQGVGFKKDQKKVFIFDSRVVNQVRKVLRMKKGDKIFVFWGDALPAGRQGNDYEVLIEEIDKNKISGVIVGREKTDRVFSYKKLILCPSLLKKPDRFEFLLEKATEIGAFKFIPIIARYSVKKAVSKNQRERWRKIIIEAVEQSGGNFIPEIEKELELREFLEKTKDISAEKIILSENANENQHISKVIDKPCTFSEKMQGKNAKEIYLLFGPEGGWSREELEFAGKYGWKSVSLGKKILRAETAAIISSFIAIQQ